MKKSYIKNIFGLLLIIVANVTITHAQTIIDTDYPGTKIIEFSLDDFNIVRTVDTIEISTDNPNYFFLEEEGTPAIPYTIVSFETNLFADYTYDIYEFQFKVILDNVILFTNTTSHTPKKPFSGLTDVVHKITADTNGNIMRVNYIISPFFYDSYVKELTFFSSFKLSLAYSGPLPENSIENISSSDREVKTENNYDLSGRPVETPTSGLTIKVTENPDGSRETKKIIVK